MSAVRKRKTLSPTQQKLATEYANAILNRRGIDHALKKIRASRFNPQELIDLGRAIAFGG